MNAPNTASAPTPVSAFETDPEYVRHRECLEHEHRALALGEDEKSFRHLLAKILCAGGYVVQDEGGDCTAERALMRYAAAVTKAIGIALNAGRSCEESHDVTLYDREAAIGLAGLSALLESAPRLIDSFDTAGVCLSSDDRSFRRDPAASIVEKPVADEEAVHQ